MCNLRKAANSCKQFGPVSTSLCPKYMKFCFQNFGNGREDENGRRQTTFGFNNRKKKFQNILGNWTFFSFLKPIVVYLHPFLASLQFPKF